MPVLLVQDGLFWRASERAGVIEIARQAIVTALADLSGRWIGVVHARRPTNVMVLDMDSSVSPTHGEQEGTAYNGHFGCTCYHPLFVFNQFGDLERCSLRSGNVHSADGWRDVLEPVVTRYHGGAITRIAAALERIAPPALPPTDWNAAPAYVWSGATVLAVRDLKAIALDRLFGIDAQKISFAENVRRHAAGLPAHDVLLWGARGMGKSACKAAVAALQADGAPLALAQAGGGPEALATLPALFDQLGSIGRRFVVFIDDIGFDGPEAKTAARSLRSLLEGGAMALPGNVRY